MRIIAGKQGGLRIHPPKNLPVRPTTDLAKEALFNILQNYVDFEQLECLDLFSGTGNISFELASRGAKKVEAVDLHFKCVKFINDSATSMKMENLKAKKYDVFKFITSAKTTYDFIFADPPYDIPQLPHLAHLIFEHQLLNPGGLLVIEHPSTRQMEKNEHLLETRKYGYSSFAFYKHTI